MADQNEDIANLSPEQREQYMAQIKEKLQIPAEADDFEVVARLVILVANLQQRYEELAATTAQTQGEMANRDLEAYKDVIPPDQADFWHERILANREETLKVLDGMRQRTAEAVAAAKPKPAPMHTRVVPIVNRKPAEVAVAPTADAERKARAIANRAQEIQRQFGLQYWDAFNKAVAEADATPTK